MFLAPSHKRTATHTVTEFYATLLGLNLSINLCVMFLLSHPIFLLLFSQLFYLLNTCFQIKKKNKAA